MSGNAEERILPMSKIVEDMITDDRKEAAIRMLEDEELSKEKIAKYLDLPLEVVEKLADSLQTV